MDELLREAFGVRWLAGNGADTALVAGRGAGWTDLVDYRACSQPNVPLACPLLRCLEEGVIGHSGSVNPKGCQRVAGGRRGFLRAGDLRATGQEMSCTPAGVPASFVSVVERRGV